jgi:hypothetical protein
MLSPKSKAVSPGVVFQLQGGRIRSSVSARADRFADRIHDQRRRAEDYERLQRVARAAGVRPVGLPIAMNIVGVIETATSDLAEALELTIRRTFCRPGSGSTYSAGDVATVLAFCRRRGLRVHGLQGDPAQRRPIARKPVTEVRAVPDPMIPRETLLEQLAEREAEDADDLARHIDQRRRDKRGQTASPLRFTDEAQPGYQYAGINLSESIGGFARVTGRTSAQTEAATEFRKLADQAQLGGARAIDYTAVKVDTSGQTASAVADSGADARSRYHLARKALGLNTRRLAVAELLIVVGLTVSEAAVRLGHGNSGSGRKKTSTLALEAATVLAIHFGFQAGGRRRVRFDGEQPTDASIPTEDAA